MRVYFRDGSSDRLSNSRITKEGFSFDCGMNVETILQDAITLAFVRNGYTQNNRHYVDYEGFIWVKIDDDNGWVEIHNARDQFGV